MFIVCIFIFNKYLLEEIISQVVVPVVLVVVQQKESASVHVCHSPDTVLIVWAQVRNSGLLGGRNNLQVSGFIHFFVSDTVQVDSLHKHEFLSLSKTYLILGVTHLNNVLVADSVGVVHQSVHSVSNRAHTHWHAESQNINGSGADQMVLNVCEFISCVSNQISLESQTEWNVQSDVGAECQAGQLNESDPFQNSCVLINDFSLFEVKLWVWLGVWCLHERLVQINWVENIVLEFEESVDWGAQEFWMAESVGNVMVLFLGFHFDIVLVTFGVEMFGDWSVGPFVFPLLDVLEVMFFVPWGVGDESVFVGEDDFLVVDVEPVESQIFELGLDWSILIHVGIDTSDTVLVGPVKITDGMPDFSLDFQVVLEVINYSVVFFDFGFLVVFIKFWVDVLRWVVVLVREPWVSFVLDFGVGFEFVEKI